MFASPNGCHSPFHRSPRGDAARGRHHRSLAENGRAEGDSRWLTRLANGGATRALLRRSKHFRNSADPTGTFADGDRTRSRRVSTRVPRHWRPREPNRARRVSRPPKANGPRERRDRVEHAQVIAPDDFARFASLGVIASMQPSHLLDDERWAADRIGPERIKGAYAWHTIEELGVHLAFGTDYPVESLNPLRGIYACVTRELPGGGPQGGWQPQEKLSMDDCLPLLFPVKTLGD